jgi:DNA-binding transcriptional ArsR family regulator
MSDSIVFDPPRARASDPGTSHQAAEAAKETAGTQRIRILRHLSTEPRGLTADQLETRMGWDSAHRRLKELKDQGLVRRMPDYRRMTRRGCLADVWAITEAGRTYLGDHEARC